MKRTQTGVALIQVLLISAVISLLALQLTYTARDQAVIATALDTRMRAQLLAYSSLKTAIFAELSDEVTVIGPSPVAWPKYQGLPLDGSFRDVSNNVSIKQLDITALLPQVYPSHPLWPLVLARSGLDENQQKSILGEMEDYQDKDDQGWSGGREPKASLSGWPYLNKQVQLPGEMASLVRHVEGLPYLMATASHRYSDYAVNFTMSPRPILEAVMSEDEASSFIQKRQNGGIDPRQALAFLPSEFSNNDAIALSPSTKRRFTVSVRMDEVTLNESWDVNLSSLSQPPWELIGRNIDD